MRFSCFRALPDSAEALVRSGGKINYHLTYYFLGNIPAKNHHIRLVQVATKPNCRGAKSSVERVITDEYTHLSSVLIDPLARVPQ